MFSSDYVRERLLLLIVGPNRARVLVAERDSLAALRTRVQVMLAGFSVVGAVSQGDRILSAVAEVRPDILVMRVQLPGESGIELTKQLMAQRPLAIVLLTTSMDQALMSEAIGSGACSYLLRSVSAARLRVALRFAALYARRYATIPR